MESFTPEQRQALQNAHQQVVQAAAQQVQQAQQGTDRNEWRFCSPNLIEHVELGEPRLE